VNLNAILLNGDFSKNAPKLFRTLGFPDAQLTETVAFDDAVVLSAPGKAVGQVSSWTVVLDPLLFRNMLEPSPPVKNALWPHAVENGLLQISKEANVFSVLISGISATYGFSFHTKGERVRCRLIQDGRLVYDYGKLLGEETEILPSSTGEEDRVWLLMNKIAFPAGSLATLTYDSYEFPCESSGD
jgi:hypothetical protein